MSSLRIPIDVVAKAIEGMKEGDDKEGLARAHRQSPLRRFVDFLPTSLSKKQVTALWKVAKTLKGEAGWKGELEFMHQAARDPSKLMVKNVRDFMTLFKSYANDGFIKGWLFERAEHGALTPYLVKSVHYTPSSKYNQESVRVDLLYSASDGNSHEAYFGLTFGTLINTFKAMNQEAAEARAKEMEEAQRELEDAEEDGDDDEDSTENKKSRRDELKKLRAKLDTLRSLPDGVPMDRILAYMGYYKETAELHEAYDKQVDRFMKLITMYGAQIRVRGTGNYASSGDDDEGRWNRWHYGKPSMLVDGRASRGIIDTRPMQDMDEESHGKRRKSRDDDADDTIVDIDSIVRDDFFPGKASNECTLLEPSNATNEMFTIPLHLELKIFHLEKHRFFKLHVVNMAPYKYKPEMADMLILPPKVDRVAKMLMASEADEAEDIVEGKSQGKMLTCIGDPGLGKTLLAEVLSEAIGKPLYKIQAAQLGLDPETLENKLRILLHRAERWDCVLMIDEANAYIHDRGVDVTQNAIVGVFLRLLEYFRGTIILTTNQTNADGSDMDIDDAILSRSSAVIRFELPTDEEALKIWNVQKKLLKAKIASDTVEKAVKHFKYSGRSIRQLIRLGWGLAKYEKKEVLTFEMLKEASEFIPVSRTERRAMAAGKLQGASTPSRDALQP